MKSLPLFTAMALVAVPTLAGPPYVTDDPEPTAFRHFEVYLFTTGAVARGGWNGAAGVDFNYGAAPDLQLTAVLPVAWNAPDAGPSTAGLGNVELAAKYRCLHQSECGADAAVFPRVLLPAGSPAVGKRHAAFLLPIWIQHARGRWTTFGGGGCEINRGGNSRDFCALGWAVSAQLSDRLQVGAEVHHEGADTREGRATTGIRLGAIYDLSGRFHLLAAAGPGLQHAAETGRADWYTALLLTY